MRGNWVSVWQSPQSNEASVKIEAGETDAAALRQALTARIEAVPGAVLDYAVVVDADSLQPLARLQGQVLIALAVALIPIAFLAARFGVARARRGDERVPRPPGLRARRRPVGRHAAHQLDGDLLGVLSVGADRAINLAHPAAPNLFEDLVDADAAPAGDLSTLRLRPSERRPKVEAAADAALENRAPGAEMATVVAARDLRSQKQAEALRRFGGVVDGNLYAITAVEHGPTIPQ